MSGGVKAPLASSEKDQQTGATSVTPAMKQQKKVAHNAIERRYRNNINDRIAALRNAVPALRELRPRKTPSGRKSRKAQTEEDLVDGVPAATKLNKATILGKATEYIKYLKSRELRLASEVTGLRELVRSLEGGEELLELWESEMEKVVAEQEAAAAATVAKEEEDLGLGLDGEDDDDDVEGEGEEDDGEELDTSSSRRESGANSPSSRASSRPAGRGGGAGSLAGMASSRYMLATFLGVSFLGGGAEFAVDMGASDSVSRVPAGRTVVGASRQLLKRAITHVQVPEEMPEPQPHHLDHVPSHVLVFEILRVVSLAACFFFLIWPLISKIWLARSSGFRQWHQARLEQTRNRKRKALLASLAKSDLEGEEIDAALRTYIGAPRTLLGSLRAMVSDGLTLATHRLGLASVLSSSVVESEDVAIWARLLEVETSLGPSAQPSLVQRIQTVMRVSALTPKLSPLAAADSLEGSARVHATLALACSRIGSEIPFAGDYAEAHWDEARQTIRKDRRRTSVPVEEAGEMDGSDAEGSEADDDDGSSTIGPRASSRDPLSDTWLETVLDLDLDDALDLVASPSEVEVSLSRLGEAKRYQLSPLISIADAFYSRELNMLWSTLFSSITRCTCPGSQPTASLSLSSPSGRDATASPLSTVRSFYRHQMHSHLDLDIIKDAPSRDEMNKRVAMIASSVPKGTTSWILSRVTLATWALALGNLPIASHIAGELLEQREAEGPTTCPSSSPAPTCPVKLSSSAHQLVKLVLGPGTLSETDEPSPLDQADALAASAIAWLDFLRLFKKTTATATSTTTTQRCEARQAIASAAIKVRRLLCKANLPSAYYSEAEEIELQEAKDEMVDILAAIGRRAARVGRSSSAHHTTRRPATSTTHDDDDDDQTKASSFRFWWNDLDSMDVGEGVDSGVELESD
ncbi:hypothetical protein IE53DRAFT_113135 [Violaceomyces palustris]|uniref:Uncharacterized protein n=1 Tax=Violaceomyces palustris TaxID=1673888 RepID=A0ACD0NW78_9BASI|nr:hypothetical protein IE53DRAFT_113135 [Violaceomyces palustris]